ncbi:transposase family protein [Amazonocrinis nigriterrae]|uniref:transposase family protein n=1 Tax=Amazonocrinis nigriterrae TaxID=2840443 RepID=UPI001CED9995|nr:transposase family protein [Amazonocrinis nigriterrae]
MSDITKRYPVILFPGIAGSRLKTRKDGSQNDHPLWFNSLVLATMIPGLSNDTSTQEVDNSTVPSASIVESDVTEADLDKTTAILPSETWQFHMKLDVDGITPKKEANGGEIINREVQGLEGIKNANYPLPNENQDPERGYYQALVDIQEGESASVLGLSQNIFDTAGLIYLLDLPKAFQGGENITTPHKRKAKQELTQQQKDENKALSSNRIFI